MGLCHRSFPQAERLDDPLLAASGREGSADAMKGAIAFECISSMLYSVEALGASHFTFHITVFCTRYSVHDALLHRLRL